MIAMNNHRTVTGNLRNIQRDFWNGMARLYFYSICQLPQEQSVSHDLPIQPLPLELLEDFPRLLDLRSSFLGVTQAEGSP